MVSPGVRADLKDFQYFAIQNVKYSVEQMSDDGDDDQYIIC